MGMSAWGEGLQKRNVRETDRLGDARAAYPNSIKLVGAPLDHKQTASLDSQWRSRASDLEVQLPIMKNFANPHFGL
jgi:hypothetical protein